jgi:dTDP-L-rhamnose 4-epimerase
MVQGDVMKVLVTGGAGFIGSHLVDRLVDDHEVTVVDNLVEQVHKGKKPDFLNSRTNYQYVDVRNMDPGLIKDQEVIFHLASEVGVGQSMYEIVRYMDANTMGTAKMLEFLANNEHSVKKLIVASSMSIYGEGAYQCDCGVVYPKLRPDEQMKANEWEMKCPKCGKEVKPIPTDEEKPLYPTSIYAISKRDQEEMCHAIGRAYGIPTVALRFFNVYGPRQSLSNPYTGVAAIFSSRIKNNNPPLIFEDGLQSRDFIHVKDIVESCILSMKSSNANYGSFNVGTGKSNTIFDIASTLIKLYGKDMKPVVENKFRSGDIRHCFADVSRIKNIGFEAKISLEEGMNDLVSWGEKENAVDDTEKAHSELVNKGLVER